MPDDDPDQLQDLPVPRRHDCRRIDLGQHDHDRRRAETGFGVPIDGTTLYNVTAFTFGRNDSFDDLYADVDATPPFDYVLGSVKK